MDPLTDAQKTELRELLSKPLIQQAFTQALCEVWEGLPSSLTVESAALSQMTMEGAQKVLKKLYDAADVKKAFTVPVRKQFRHETPIV
jgi:hypothetical protein